MEFALIAMILILMLLGIAEFGRAWATQASLAQASREAAREMAIQEDVAVAATHFNVVFSPFGAPDLDNVVPTISVTGTPGDPACRVSVQAEYPLQTMTGLFGNVFTIGGKGVMRCGG